MCCQTALLCDCLPCPDVSHLCLISSVFGYFSPFPHLLSGRLFHFPAPVFAPWLCFLVFILPVLHMILGFCLVWFLYFMCLSFWISFSWFCSFSFCVHLVSLTFYYYTLFFILFCYHVLCPFLFHMTAETDNKWGDDKDLNTQKGGEETQVKHMREGQEITQEGNLTGLGIKNKSITKIKQEAQGSIKEHKFKDQIVSCWHLIKTPEFISISRVPCLRHLQEKSKRALLVLIVTSFCGIFGSYVQYSTYRFDNWKETAFLLGSGSHGQWAELLDGTASELQAGPSAWDTAPPLRPVEPGHQTSVSWGMEDSGTTLEIQWFTNTSYRATVDRWATVRYTLDTLVH